MHLLTKDPETDLDTVANISCSCCFHVRHPRWHLYARKLSLIPQSSKHREEFFDSNNTFDLMWEQL